MSESLNLSAGDWVEVRSKAEILQTLDQDGRLDGMPFMPEMFAFCGRRFRVQARAHKTCDTVFPIRSRRISHAVHLETRCDGQAHGGCQAGCLLFWKEAWLRPVDAGAAIMVGRDGAPMGREVRPEINVDGDAAVLRATRDDANDIEPVYSCQATRLPYASDDLSPYDVWQYIEDYTSGNVRLGQWLRGVVYITYSGLINLGIGLGPLLRWVYEAFQRLHGGLPYPRRPGRIPMGEPTPTASLNLQPGEWVRVKSYEDILATCTKDNRNRGMGFDGEMMPFCGGTYRVLRRITKIINEKTGKMQHMKNPCIVLEDVVCQGRYSECRMFCPRAIFPYWREIWLERVAPPDTPAASRQ